jgi:hypothetical protein
MGMDKIATPKDLVSELQRVIAYAGSEKPSRAKLSKSLTLLASLVEGTSKPLDQGEVAEYLEQKMRGLKLSKPSMEDLTRIVKSLHAGRASAKDLTQLSSDLEFDIKQWRPKKDIASKQMSFQIEAISKYLGEVAKKL